MGLIQDDAIVLRRLDYSETSEVLVGLTREHGKVRFIGKGLRKSTKKRFSPGIDLLERGELVLYVRQSRQDALATLREWDQVTQYWGLRDHIDRLMAAQYIADVTAGLTEDWDPHPVLFSKLDEALVSLSTADRVFSVLVGYQRAVLEEAGVFPKLDGCVVCAGRIDTTREVYFSSFEGGLLCRDCESSRMEKRRVLVSGRALASRRLTTASDVAGGFDLFHYHLSHLLGRVPAAGKHLENEAKKVQNSRD
jgi:DNA repair protein RecO (recombination protein O)